MYWNPFVADKLYDYYGWIVTLDVLKFCTVLVLFSVQKSWIVTLDVLKFL